MIPLCGVVYGIGGAMADNFGTANLVYGAVYGNPGTNIFVYGSGVRDLWRRAPKS
jgi:succinylarginine dihydrolase